MGTEKVRTNSGHDAGPHGKRRTGRAIVKGAARIRRREEDKDEIKKGLKEKDRKVDEASFIRRRGSMPSGFQPVGDREMHGGTWEPGTDPHDVLCPSCGEPWSKGSPAGMNISLGNTRDCPACMPLPDEFAEKQARAEIDADPINDPVSFESACSTGAIAMPVGYNAPRRKKKLITDKDKHESFEQRVDQLLQEDEHDGVSCEFCGKSGSKGFCSPDAQRFACLDCNHQNRLHWHVPGTAYQGPRTPATPLTDPSLTNPGPTQIPTASAVGALPMSAMESWEPGKDFIDFIDEAIDPAAMAGLANNVSSASPGSSSLGPNSRLKKLAAVVGATKNKAVADQRNKKEMDDLKDEVEDIKGQQAGK